MFLEAMLKRDFGLGEMIKIYWWGFGGEKGIVLKRDFGLGEKIKIYWLGFGGGELGNLV